MVIQTEVRLDIFFHWHEKKIYNTNALPICRAFVLYYS